MVTELKYGKILIDDYIIREDAPLVARILDDFEQVSVSYDNARGAHVYYGYSDKFEDMSPHEPTPTYAFIENEDGDIRFLKIGHG